MNERETCRGATMKVNDTKNDCDYMFDHPSQNPLKRFFDVSREYERKEGNDHGKISE